MNNKKLINLQTFSVIILLIVFLIGVLFFTDLLPPINKEKEPNQTETAENIAETKGVAIENKSEAKELDKQPSRAGNTTGAVAGGSYVPPICQKTSIPYQKVYDKVAWLNVDQTEVKKKGREGYKQVCSPDSNGNKPADITVQPINEEVFVGTKNKATESGLSKALGRILGSND